MVKSKICQITFERYNSKYNRLWGQLTSISLFFIGTFLAYYGLQYDFSISFQEGNITIARLILFQRITIIYIIILLLIVSVFSFLFSHLLFTGKKLRQLFRDWELNY